MTDRISAEDYQKLLKDQKTNKYGAKKTVVDGITFDSKREAERYGELKLLRLAGKIADLDLQVPFPLTVNGVVIGKWVADFVYWDTEEGKWIYEDCKGYRTDLYKRTKKHVEAQYDIKILET